MSIHTCYDYRQLFELQAADIIQPDITHFGGLLETKKLAAWAEAYYLLVAAHNAGGPVSTATALHFAASTPNFKILEHFNDFAEDRVKAAAPGNPEVKDGYFALPQGPGLGVKLDEEVIRQHPHKRSSFTSLLRTGTDVRRYARSLIAHIDSHPQSWHTQRRAAAHKL